MYKYSLHLIASLAILIFSTPMIAQLGEGGTSKIEQLQKTKTYVVLEENNATYNKAIQLAVNNYWTFTEFEFIDKKEYIAEKCELQDVSFLMKFPIESGYFEDEEIENLGIYIPDNKDCLVSAFDFIGYANLITENEMQYYSLTVQAINFIQNYLAIGLENNLPKVETEKVINIYNKQSFNASGYELLLSESELYSDDYEHKKIKTAYDHRYKLVDRFEIDKAIAKRSENVIYSTLFYNLEANIYRLFVDAETGEIIYAKQSKGRAFNHIDLKTIKDFSGKLL